MTYGVGHIERLDEDAIRELGRQVRLRLPHGCNHADVGRGWTIAELGRRAGMSRSVFAWRFSEAVGAAPVEYLLRWRMALAKDALLHGRARWTK